MPFISTKKAREISLDEKGLWGKGFDRESESALLRTEKRPIGKICTSPQV